MVSRSSVPISIIFTSNHIYDENLKIMEEGTVHLKIQPPPYGWELGQLSEKCHFTLLRLRKGRKTHLHCAIHSFILL